MDLSSLEQKLAALGGGDAPPPAPSASSSSNLTVPSKTKYTKKKATSKTKRSSPSTGTTTTTTSSRFDKLYQQGQKKLAKQRQARRQAPVGCTFSPRTNVKHNRNSNGSNGSNGGGGSSSSRFDRLYENARKTKAKLDGRRQQKQLKPDGCTFNPRTNADKKHKVEATTRDARFTRLYNDAAKTRAKIASERARRAAADATFQPKITRKGQRAASPSPSARFDKLYKDGQRDLDSQRAKQRADRELAECTFSPQINKSSSTRSSSARRTSRGGGGQNFVDRLTEYGKRAEERLDRKRMERNSIRDKEATFQPNTNSRRRNNRHSTGGMGHRYRGEESVEEAAKRLSQVETKAQYEKRLARRRKELAEQEGQTFQPRVNKTRSSSARRSRNSTGGGGGGGERTSIWERLNKESVALSARQKKWKEQREAREMKQCTFQPKSSHSATKRKKGGAKKKKNQAGFYDVEKDQTEKETKPVWDRLSNVNLSQERMLRDEMKKKKELKACTFQPTLSKHHRSNRSSSPRGSRGSPATASKRVPIWERLNSESKHRAAEREKKKREYELKECTFSPHLSKSSAKLTERPTSPGGTTISDAAPIWERLSDQATEKREAQKEAEVKKAQMELKGCTFTPEVLPSSQAMIDGMFDKDDATSALERLSSFGAQTASSKRHSVNNTAAASKRLSSSGTKKTKTKKKAGSAVSGGAVSGGAVTTSASPSAKDLSSLSLPMLSKVQVVMQEHALNARVDAALQEEVEDLGGGEGGEGGKGGGDVATNGAARKTGKMASALASQANRHAEAIFQLLDSDHNGEIEKKQFRHGIHKFDKEPSVMKMYALAGFGDKTPVKEDLKALFREIDHGNTVNDATYNKDHQPLHLTLNELTVWFEMKLKTPDNKKGATKSDKNSNDGIRTRTGSGLRVLDRKTKQAGKPKKKQAAKSATPKNKQLLGV